MRTSVLGFVLALVAAACSGDGSAGGGTSPGPDSGSDPESPFRLRDGPLLGVMLTTEHLEDGSDEPRLVFTTNDREVTAVVVLGDDVDQGATLSIVWSSLRGIDERSVLFTHDVQVGPGGEAFSVGVAETGIAPGRYEVAATLGDANVRLPWRVEVAEGGPGAGKARMAGAVSQIGDEDWNVPDSGSSAWNEPTPDVPPAEPGPCEITSLSPGFDPMRTVDARVGWTGMCSSMNLDVAVSGSPTTVSSVDQPTAPQLFGRADLCELPGGSDLPGTVVSWTATGSDGAAATKMFTVPDFGEALMVEIASVPDPGQVDPGQRIALRGMAIAVPTALGVRALIVSVNGEPIERVGNASETSSPEPCDDGRLGAVVFTHYDVPQDAPPVIEICGRAIGFDGTEAEHCIEFTTGEVWTGSFTGTGVNHPPGTCEPAATYDYTIEIVVGPGDVATLTGHGITGSNCAPTTTENDLFLTGTRTATGFEFPGPEFPAPMTITTSGSRGTGEGHGFVEAFEYTVTVEIERVGSSGS